MLGSEGCGLNPSLHPTDTSELFKWFWICNQVDLEQTYLLKG